jgi:predicted O-linked N-acetylglucosamine transferase (SPINDLY family)
MASIEQLFRQAERHLQQGQPQAAETLYGRILDKYPRNGQALFRRAQLQAQAGNPRGALDSLRRLMEIEPAHAEACFGLAALYQGLGETQQAVAWFRRAHALRPGDPVTLYNLALGLQALNQEEEAVHCYREAVGLDPRFVQANNNLGNILLRRDHLDEAMACYQRALAVDGSLVEANYNLGLVLKKRKRPAEAEDYLQRALRLKPDHAQALFTLGALRQERGDYAAAVPWYQKAIAVDPRYAEAHSNLGVAYQHLGQFEAAIGQIATAIRVCTAPGQAGDGAAGTSFSALALDALYYNLGYLYRKQGRSAEWYDNFTAFRERARDGLYLWLYGRDVALLSGDFATAGHYLAKLVGHRFLDTECDDLVKVLSEIQYAETDPANILSLHRQFNALAVKETGGLSLAPSPAPLAGRKIRLGYLSPDFNRHVMGSMMLDVLGRHDRERFQIHCYALGSKTDEITARFTELSDRFASLGNMAALDAARRIAEDRLDILVDLAGLTEGSNPMILAYRPAPLQITHLGYHGSIGLEAVDFKLTDRHADLPDNERHMLEGLLPMGCCVMPFHHEDAAATGSTRAELGIAEDAVVFGEFVSIMKLSQGCLETWRAILERLDKAVLAFSPFLARDREAFLKLLAAAGIAAERVAFIPAGTTMPESRARYRLLDIVLDTFPYSGGDTTMAALDMAVPVVTLCGTRQSERMTCSILRHLGLDECVAESRAEFVDLACRLALEPEWRRGIAERIPRLLVESGMADMADYTRHLEQAYLEALRQKGFQ